MMILENHLQWLEARAVQKDSGVWQCKECGVSLEIAIKEQLLRSRPFWADKGEPHKVIHFFCPCCQRGSAITEGAPLFLEDCIPAPENIQPVRR